MIHKLRLLGLAVVAMLAVGVLGASTASAAELHSESAPVTITGTQEGESNALDIQFGEVKCKTADYTATTTATTDTTVTLTPTYGGCTFAGVASTIDMNGCHYLLHVISPSQGTLTVVCPAGQEITKTGGTKCIFHVPAQTLGTVSLSNIGAGATREITVGLGGVNAITYSQTPGSGVGKCSAITTSSGKLTGTATFTGETDPGGVHVGLFVT